MLRITLMDTAAINFCLGTRVRIDFTRENNYDAHLPVPLNCCVEYFPNNGDDFGSASDEDP